MKKQIVKITAEEAKSAIESGLWVCSRANGPGGAAFIKKSGDIIESFAFPFFRDGAREAALSGYSEIHGIKSAYKADSCSLEDEEKGATLFYDLEEKEVYVVTGEDIPSSIIREFEEQEEIALLKIRPK